MRNTQKAKLLKKQNKTKQIKMKEKRNHAYSISGNNYNIANLSGSNVRNSIIRWRVNR